MKKYLLIVVVCLFAGCTRMVKLEQKHSPAEFTSVFYKPSCAGGFKIFALPPDDSALLMLEVYHPDTARVMIPRDGFKRVVAMSSTYAAHLEAADRLDRLVGVSSPQYISSEAVKELDLPDVGHDGAMNYEQLLAVKPELVMLYGVGGPSPIVGKLEELGIPYVYLSDFEEQTPLGRAEWLVASGALVGADMRDEFARIKQAYKPVEDSVAVMINAPYGGTWFLPGRDGYMSRLIADAGGYIVATQQSGSSSVPIDYEPALVALSRADLWLCPGASTSLKELEVAVPKARFSGAVWNQLPRFYEDGAMRPDSVLGELKMIMAGSAPTDSLRYFYRLK